MKKFFILFLMTLSGFAFAGHQTKSFLVQFPTDQHSLDQKALDQLNQVCQFLKEHPDAQVKLTGRTDFDGSINYNIILSRARTAEVADFLAQNGYSKSEIDEKWVGEIRPIASNLHEEGKALNRSVEILIIIPFFENTSSWLKEKEKEYEEEFVLKKSGENKITTQNGSVITIPGNAFVDESGIAIDNKNVKVVVKEVNTALDALINGVFTMAGDQLLETGGMLNITASYKEKALNLGGSKELKIDIPTISNQTDMFVFQGVPDSKGNIDWKKTSNTFNNTKAVKRESIKLNEDLLLKLIADNTYTKPEFKRHNFNYLLPKIKHYPSRPNKPTKPIKPEAKDLYSPFVYFFTTKNMREGAVEKAHTKNMEEYNKRFATYEKRLDKYNAEVVIYKNDMKRFDQEKEAFYAWLRTGYLEIDKEINNWVLYHDKKRIHAGLDRLYQKSKRGTLYDKNPLVSFKSIALKYRLDPTEENILAYLLGVQSSLARLATTPYDQIQKKYSNNGSLSIARLKGRNLKGNTIFTHGRVNSNKHLDVFFKEHKSEFTALFNEEFERHLAVAAQKEKMSEESKAQAYFSGNSSNLGWINCDRFANQPLVKINSEIVPGAIQMVVLSNMRSMLRTAVDDLKALTYAKIPTNNRFKLVTFKIEGDMAYLSIIESVAVTNLKIEPKLQKMPLSEANILLASL